MENSPQGINRWEKAVLASPSQSHFFLRCPVSAAVPFTHFPYLVGLKEYDGILICS